MLKLVFNKPETCLPLLENREFEGGQGKVGRKKKVGKCCGKIGIFQAVIDISPPWGRITVYKHYSWEEVLFPVFQCKKICLKWEFVLCELATLIKLHRAGTS